MKRLTIVCMLAALASPALYVQSAAAYQKTRTAPDVGSNSAFGMGTSTLREADETNRRAYEANQAKLTALRAQLAEGWQSLGMSKDAAQQVAATYMAKGTPTPHHVSVLGKTDQEIAAMLQAALAKKDFNQANQTLIAFQRKRLADDAKTSPKDQN